jgi:hypothetical protein
MPARTPCAKCGVIGFVRWEHVVTGGREITEYACGKCQQSWQIEHRSKPPSNSPRGSAPVSQLKRRTAPVPPSPNMLRHRNGNPDANDDENRAPHITKPQSNAPSTKTENK